MKTRAASLCLLLAAGCTAAPTSEPAPSASASAAAPSMDGTALCHALLLAPLDRKLASCGASDRGPDLEAEKDAIAKAHAQCLEEVGVPLEEGRLALDEEKARACIAAIERAGTAWVGLHARVLDLASMPDCRGMLSPMQRAGDVCTTALECPPEITCDASDGRIGRCISQNSRTCSPQTLSFGIARRNECQGASTCRTTARRDSLDGLGDPRLRTTPAIVRLGEATTSGGLPPAVVRRIVRQQVGRFRKCYDAALRKKPDIVGEVRLAFTIARDGSVTGVSTRGSSFADTEAAQCVATAISSLSFPAPEGQPVRVGQSVGFGSANEVKAPSLPTGYTPHAVEREAWVVIGECEPAGTPACSAHADCGVGEYCSTGPSPEEPNRCLPRKAAGSACRQSSECKGRCVADACVSSCGSG